MCACARARTASEREGHSPTKTGGFCRNFEGITSGGGNRSLRSRLNGEGRKRGAEKKKASAVAGKLSFFVSRPCCLEPGRKRLKVTCWVRPKSDRTISFFKPRVRLE